MGTPTIAQTTLSQLGGSGRLTAMIGADGFGAADDDATLVFRFKGSRKGGNVVHITLDATDTYSVTFFKCSGYSYNRVGAYDGVHADQLRNVFETHTGLYLSL